MHALQWWSLKLTSESDTSLQMLETLLKVTNDLQIILQWMKANLSSSSASGSICFWHLVPLTMKFCNIVFIMYLLTLCNLGFNHTYRIKHKLLLYLVNTPLQLFFIKVYLKDQSLDFLCYTYSLYRMS